MNHPVQQLAADRHLINRALLKCSRATTAFCTIVLKSKINLSLKSWEVCCVTYEASFFIHEPFCIHVVLKAPLFVHLRVSISICLKSLHKESLASGFLIGCDDLGLFGSFLCCQMEEFFQNPPSSFTMIVASASCIRSPDSLSSSLPIMSSPRISSRPCHSFTPRS